MSESEDEGDKPHEATQKRLDDARRKGEIAISADLTSAVAFTFLLIFCVAFGEALLERTGLFLASLLREALLPQTLPWPASSGTFIFSPWFVFPLIGACLSLTGQRAFVFALEKLMPKASRISPVSNAKQKFGRKGLFEFAKSSVKLVIFSIVLFFFILTDLERILSAAGLEQHMAVAELFGAALRFFLVTCVLFLVAGAFDYLWQSAEHLRKNRMSRKEVMDESKEQEGDPYLKAERRAKAQEIANRSMIKDVADATVVVVNPLHYAVALRWDRSSPGAPVCVAKGVDHIAARIREAAAEAGVPIHRDAPTARALHASVDVGDEIDPDHYEPVAAAIRFAERMRRQAKGRR